MIAHYEKLRAQDTETTRMEFQAQLNAATADFLTAKTSLVETVEKQKICMHDVIGRAPNRNTIPDLDLALRELEQMDGLSEVKSSINQIVDLAAANYHRELKGIQIL